MTINKKGAELFQNNIGTLLLAVLFFLSQYVFNSTQDEISEVKKAVYEWQRGQNQIIVEVATLSAQVSQLETAVNNADTLKYTSVDAERDMQLSRQRDDSLESQINSVVKRVERLEQTQ